MLYDVLEREGEKQTSGGRIFGALVENRRIPTNAACDNLFWSTPTTLLSGCHPQALRFAKYSTDPSTLVSPSEIIQITIDGASDDDGSGDVVETIYLDPTGETISASSVAAIMGDNALYIGTVHDGGILKCPASSRGDAVPQAQTREWSWWGGSVLVGVVVALGSFLLFSC